MNAMHVMYVQHRMYASGYACIVCTCVRNACVYVYALVYINDYGNVCVCVYACIVCAC